MTSAGTRYGGRYEIVEPIASGGMAEVFRAKDQLLGRSVALKILHPEYARDHAFIERFRREAQSAASLNDPRIVSVFDWGSDDGTYYLVMEFVDGRTLRDVIGQEGPLSPERSAEIASEVLSALELAHNQKIVHRDVKPANIVLTSRGQTKVMDFGIARAAADSGQTVTKTGTIMGTANYLSPEQAQGTEVDARSDVYSVGVVLYEMLTREVPFKADTPVAIAYKHVKEDPVPPSRLNPDIPQEIDAIVMKALSKNPDNRYQTAAEMRDDLQRVLRGESVQATPLLPPDQTVVSQREDATRSMPAVPVEPSKARKALAYMLIFLLFAGILIGVIALLFALLSPKGPAVVVPDVTGQPLVEAERILERDGLSAQVDREVFSDSVARGSVVSQDPGEGRKIRRGDTVRLVISKGPEQLEVPDLTGKTQEEAERLIEAAGLRVGSVDAVFSDEVEKGLVVSQNPRPGDRVEVNTPVDIQVSSGRSVVRVPDVRRITEERAREILLERGLNPVVVDGCDTGEANDRVLTQSPAAGEQVPEGSDVMITVNRAPRVPDVTGDTEAQAREKLTAAGFKVDSRKRSAPTATKGTVVDQDPDAGTNHCKGDTVVIYVAD